MTSRRDTLRLIGGAAVSLSSMAGPARAAASAGSVVGVRGSCFAEAQGQRRPLKLGDAIEVEDTIVVADPGGLKLRMSDGSVLSLAAATRMAIAGYRTDAAGQRQAAQLSLSQGLLRAVVASVDHPASFEVSTAVGTAAVRSTDWFIEAKPGSAQVGVLTGRVSLESAATGRSVTIPAHWGGRLEAGRDPTMPRLWAPAEFDAVISRTDVN
jgi:hypothetical protein